MVAEAATLDVRSVLIDGEAVVMDADGRSSFQGLQGALKGAPATIDFIGFDLLELDSEDLTGLPLTERQARLRAALPEGSHRIRCCEHVEGNGEKLLHSFCDAGLEGRREGPRCDARRSPRSRSDPPSAHLDGVDQREPKVDSFAKRGDLVAAPSTFSAIIQVPWPKACTAVPSDSATILKPSHLVSNCLGPAKSGLHRIRPRIRHDLPIRHRHGVPRDEPNSRTMVGGMLTAPLLSMLVITGYLLSCTDAVPTLLRLANLRVADAGRLV